VSGQGTETSVRNYHYSQRVSQRERSSNDSNCSHQVMSDDGPWCFKQPRDGGTISGRQSVQVRQGAHTGHILIDDVHCRGSAADSHGFASSCRKTQPPVDTGPADIEQITVAWKMLVGLILWRERKKRGTTWPTKDCVSQFCAWPEQYSLGWVFTLDPRRAEFLFSGWN